MFKNKYLYIFLLLAATCAGTVHAQNYPTRPVRIIVAFAPGGANDIVTRVVAQKLAETWGQSIVVDNRGGAGGNIGADLAAKANPDGYTLFMTSGSIVSANQHIYRNMPFNPEKDFAAITMVASGPQILVVNPSFAAKSLKDFIAMAKAKPKTITMGTAGFGTQTHLAGENFMHAAGIEAVHVPYKGEGPALVDLLGGQINFVPANLPAAIGQVQQGKLRGLGVTSLQRLKQLPDVPAVAETLPGFENLGWFGFVVPTGTPKAVIDIVYADTAKALQAPDIRARYEQLGMVPVGDRPEQFAKTIKEETVRWGKIVRERNLVAN
jgi:tripartite-type tricarboxylate transporter receptor subunit TctC